MRPLVLVPALFYALPVAFFLLADAPAPAQQPAQPPAASSQPVWRAFERRQLTDVYYSEGIGAGDLNRDGHVDLVYGPYWFAGPDWQEKRELFTAVPQPRERYANHFFAWVYDLDGDGWNDVLTAGFPGTPAIVYRNPGAEKHDQPWPKHVVLDSVANESPQWVNVTGDERPELLCTNQGFYGYATWDPARPFESWTFHAISEKTAPNPFGHGLGAGDVDGDGRVDILSKDGWYQQPADLAASPRWTFHPFPFAAAGGAEMYAYDVDGDGDQDVITSLAAHEFGLAWFEQVREGGEITFRRRLIMGDQPGQNRYGLVISELHSVNLADIDGDGLKDIVTGKTYWSHHRQSPQWDAGAVVYWFRLVRTKDGVDWVPYRADGESGIGRQLLVHDLDRDGHLDLAAGGMKGAHVLLQRPTPVSDSVWRERQPKLFDGPVWKPLEGKPVVFAGDSRRVAGVLEAESLKVVKATGGRAGAQEMRGFSTGRWSDDKQLFWGGAKPGDRLELEVEAAEAGEYSLSLAFTLARDFGIVRVSWNDQPLGQPLDLYASPDVLASGEVSLGVVAAVAGKNRLTLEITGANPAAVKAHIIGVDYLRLTPK
ncbi:MAG: VCBS repeat-containing protein [Pirellulales bacterium]